ncbi:heme-degrading domain-containing protein [Modestobacter sp. NPDC049651]|uniref:heme-degrading domain-containing protein n=1 Tax=unclassified Modestobacter TaxID=2643866 RepID=UPI0033FB8325
MATVQPAQPDFPTLAELAAEEEELQFTRFTNDDAWSLGVALVTTARERGLPVAVDVSRNGHQLFHASLPGTVPDNDTWIARKAAVVQRFGHSSLYVRQKAIENGTTFEEVHQLDPQQFRAHGGAFPVLVRGVGHVGTAVVSGLPMLEDHRLLVEVLRAQIAGQSS